MKSKRSNPSRLTATAAHPPAGVAALPGAIWTVIASPKRWDLERSLQAFGAELTELGAAWQLRRAISPQKQRFISIIWAAAEEVTTRCQADESTMWCGDGLGQISSH